MKRSVRIHCLTCLLLLIALIVMPACKKDTSKLDAVQTQSLCWPVGITLPQASDFLVNPPADITARYAKDNQFGKIGVYDIQIVLADAEGSEITKTVQFSLIEDTQPPVISGVKDIAAYIGKPVAYKSGITVLDNCSCEVELFVDSSKVDLYTVGSYPITYTARDAVGNETVVEATVHVYDFEITTDMLNAKIDEALATIVGEGMTREEQCKAIYKYVYDNIKYISTSDKTDWVRAAYLGIDEGQGDCFTYYALSKAFLERLGIENMCIQRSAAASAQLGETHFWNYVNLGDAQNPRWYHFDTTHLRDAAYTGKLCLITEQQLQYYNRFIRTDRGMFYDYDHTGYPLSTDVIVNSVIKIS